MGLLCFSERMGWINICEIIKHTKYKKQTVFSLIHVLSARFIVNHHVASIHQIKLCSSVSYYICMFSTSALDGYWKNTT